MTVYKSTAITNLDASPILRANAGLGSPGYLKNVGATIAVPSASTTGDLYRLVRVPANVILKHIWVWVDASVTTLGCDFGAHYSTSTTDGTQPLNIGTAIDINYFGANVDLHTVAYPIDLVSSKATSSAITGALLNIPLWQTLAVAADPFGFIDLTMTPGGTTNGAAVLNFSVEFV